MLVYSSFTFVCPTEIQAFSAAAAKFAGIKTRVAAISTDTVHCHLAWTQAKKSAGGA